MVDLGSGTGRFVGALHIEQRCIWIRGLQCVQIYNISLQSAVYSFKDFLYICSGQHAAPQLRLSHSQYAVVYLPQHNQALRNGCMTTILGCTAEYGPASADHHEAFLTTTCHPMSQLGCPWCPIAAQAFIGGGVTSAQSTAWCQSCRPSLHLSTPMRTARTAVQILSDDQSQNISQSSRQQ